MGIRSPFYYYMLDMKDEDIIKSLLEKHQKGTISDAEKALLDNWYLYVAAEPSEELSDKERIQTFDKVFINLQRVVNGRKVRNLWPVIAATASILLFLSFGVYLVLHQSDAEGKWEAQNFKNDIAPGTNGATLTLGNGKTIALNTRAKGTVVVEGNTIVKKSDDGQLEYHVSGAAENAVMDNTLTTGRKEQYKVVLSDGTNVWLNAASSIKYPAEFSGKDREVAITGEAYFEVAHNASRPFKVISGGQTIEVLGTHFNVNTYIDEPDVETTLLEGSVKVSNGNAFEIIKPGEQAVLKATQLSVHGADLEETIAWKNGYFRFNQESIESIMRKLSRWYDIDIQYDGPALTEKYSGKISRFRNISEVLKVFEYTGSVHFKIEGRRVTVSK